MELIFGDFENHNKKHVIRYCYIDFNMNNKITMQFLKDNELILPQNGFLEKFTKLE